MDPLTVATLITTVGPSIVGAIKKGLWKERSSKTEGEKTLGLLAPAEETKRAINSVLPVLVGLAVAVLESYVNDGLNWREAILTGLAGGAGAHCVRDLDKNFIGAAGLAAKLLKKKEPSHE